MPNPSLEKRPRRRLTAEYTRLILEQADACGARAELAALLRRENARKGRENDTYCYYVLNACIACVSRV